jgi:hypothetical protein
VAYAPGRDRPDLNATSRLSENLTYGEISPRTVWHGGLRARRAGSAGAETFLKELVWREFAWHLIWHTPHIETATGAPEWDGFPWRGRQRACRALAARHDRRAGGRRRMREMYVTGTMHNRVRMLVASYLTKHLMTHWKVGLDWFADCLIDWDPASNAMGWQWAAGSGPDAAPYFRIFNPDTQAEKFDPDGTYRRRWIGTVAPRRPCQHVDVAFGRHRSRSTPASSSTTSATIPTSRAVRASRRADQVVGHVLRLLADGGAMEWACDRLDTVFAQRATPCGPASCAGCSEILRFNRQARAPLADGRARRHRPRRLAGARGFSRWFRDCYILPMGGAIWSTPIGACWTSRPRASCASSRTTTSAGLDDRQRWRTVDGGSANTCGMRAAAWPARRDRGRAAMGSPARAGVRRCASPTARGGRSTR